MSLSHELHCISLVIVWRRISKEFTNNDWLLAGNWNKGQDNLNPKYYEAFADYLTEVVLKYKEWGLQFDTLAPFNEPSEGWWYIDRNKAQQEGCNFSTKSMDKVFDLLLKADVCFVCSCTLDLLDRRAHGA